MNEDPFQYNFQTLNTSSSEFNPEEGFGLKYLPPRLDPTPTPGYHPSHQYIRYGNQPENTQSKVPLEFAEVVSARTAERTPTPEFNNPGQERYKFAKIAYTKYGSNHEPVDTRQNAPTAKPVISSYPSTPYPSQSRSVYGDKLQPGTSKIITLQGRLWNITLPTFMQQM